MAKVFDGKKLAQEVKDELKTKVSQLREKTGKAPKLASLLVGEDSATRSFLTIKQNLAAEIGVEFELQEFGQETEPAVVVRWIQAKNADPTVHGILVQLPLPAQFDTNRLLKSLHPFKDVDCLHPKNLGILALGQPIFLPPVVLALQKLLKAEKISLKNARTGVVGRGRLVGLPLSLWLMRQEGTLSVFHSQTKDLPKQTKEADILISGVGKPGLIGAMGVKRGAVVINFGYSRDERGQLSGDVRFATVEKKTKLITPVPGGMGPLVALGVLENTVSAFEKAFKHTGQPAFS